MFHLCLGNFGHCHVRPHQVRLGERRCRRLRFGQIGAGHWRIVRLAPGRGQHVNAGKGEDAGKSR
jgi:hypothetical protein